jgi:ribonuclease J
MRARIQRNLTPSGDASVELESQGQRIVLEFSLVGLRVVSSARELVPHLDDLRPVPLGAFTVTPFLVDHSASAFDAILVEADGAAVFAIGDLKTGAVQKLLGAPPDHVDALLMDDMAIGRAAGSDGYPTEADFEEKFVSLFRNTVGMPLVWCSRQNIDRIVTIFRACLRTNRQFIVDMSTADVLRTPGQPHVPPGMADRIRVFVPHNQVRRLKRKGALDSAPSAESASIHCEGLAAAAGTSVMLFRPSLMQDVEQAKCLAGARLVFSMWSGYLEYEKSNPFLEWLERHGIPLDWCHTSGHAGLMELVKLREAFPGAPVVPIRSRKPGRFDELLGSVQRREGGEWWEIGSR